MAGGAKINICSQHLSGTIKNYPYLIHIKHANTNISAEKFANIRHPITWDQGHKKVEEN